jgi:hypothetical protein
MMFIVSRKRLRLITVFFLDFNNFFEEGWY